MARKMDSVVFRDTGRRGVGCTEQVWPITLGSIRWTSPLAARYCNAGAQRAANGMHSSMGQGVAWVGREMERSLNYMEGQIR